MIQLIVHDDCKSLYQHLGKDELHIIYNNNAPIAANNKLFFLIYVNKFPYRSGAPEEVDFRSGSLPWYVQ